MKKKLVLFSAFSAALYVILDSNIMHSMTAILAPIFLSFLAYTLVAAYLLFFNREIQMRSWRWFQWTPLLPIVYAVSLIPTYLGQGWVGGGGIYAGLDIAYIIFWGIIVGVILLIYTLYHRFYRKTGVAKN
jgi:hypothetical protein